MITISDVQDFLSGNDIYSLLDGMGATPFEQALRAFHSAVMGAGIARGIDPEVSRSVLGARDRIAGFWSLVVEGRMPHWPAFGPLALSLGDAETNYDRARTYLLRHRRRAAFAPVAGMFYPELLAFPPVERVIALAESHVPCKPTSRRTANLHSLQGRFSEGVASKAAQPNGTTCALFLRAVLVGAGDGRFLKHPQRLGLKAPGRGDMAAGVGCGFPALKDDGQKVVGRPGGDPTAIRRGDLYFITGASGLWQESGHVGLVVEAAVSGDRVEVVTIDGGQKEGDEIWSGGKGWFTKKKRGVIRRAGDKWEKCSRDRNGLVCSPQIEVTHRDTKEKKKENRVLSTWVAMREVAGGFQMAADRLGPVSPFMVGR